MENTELSSEALNQEPVVSEQTSHNADTTPQGATDNITVPIKFNKEIINLNLGFIEI